GGPRGPRRGRHRLLRAGRELPLAAAERPRRHLHHAAERGGHRRVRGEAPVVQAPDAHGLTCAPAEVLARGRLSATTSPFPYPRSARSGVRPCLHPFGPACRLEGSQLAALRRWLPGYTCHVRVIPA